MPSADDWIMGAAADPGNYDIMTGIPIGQAPTYDPREAFKDAPWALQAIQKPTSFEPLTSKVFPDYRPPDETTFRQRFAGGAPTELPSVGAPAIPSGPTWGGSERANRAADVMGAVAAQTVIPQSTTDAGMMLMPGGFARKAVGGVIGSLFDADPAEAGKGKITAAGINDILRAGRKVSGGMQVGGMTSPIPGAKASAEEINRAARESLRGISQPELVKLYDELGLTGGAPRNIVAPSLAAKQPGELIQQATDLKLADRAYLDTLSKAERKEYLDKGKLPGGALLPSQEAAQPALQAFMPVKKEITRAEQLFDANVEKGIKPSIFDLSAQTLNQTPNVPQFNLPRVAPGITERLASVPRGGMARLERAAGAAPEENWGWYNLMQARDIFHNIHGPQRGEQAFQTWLDGVAGTSMVNPIDNNLRSSTWYLQQILQGNPLPEVLHIRDPVSGKMVKTMAGGPPPGYGAKSQIQHADRVKEYMTNSYDPVTNPKPISYRNNLSGNWMPRTVDTHDIRNMVGMPYAIGKDFGENAALLPKEYSYLEGVGQRAANRAGRPQAGQQAATWVGGGEYTGLKSYPAPLLEALNRRAHVTGAVRGQPAWDVLLDAFKGKEPLL